VLQGARCQFVQGTCGGRQRFSRYDYGGERERKVGACQFVPLDDTQTEDTAGGGGEKEETPSAVATVSGKAVARAATGTTSSAAPLARPSEEWPMWPTWEPPSARASLPEPSGALRRLVPKLEDCARRMAVSNRPQSARDLVPGVVCADTDTAASAFWDCEDLVWWVTSKWSVPDNMQAYCRRPDVTRLTRLVLLVRGGDHARHWLRADGGIGPRRGACVRRSCGHGRRGTW
jgi:hypothetical protein